MNSEIAFVKMNGLGNDYVFIDLLEGDPGEIAWREVARWVSSRNRGIGSDGLILVLPAPAGSGADAAMRMFNSDGSEGEMCGNGVRCLAWYVCRRGKTRGDLVRVWTPGAMISARVHSVEEVEVDMGPAAFEGPDLPLAEGGKVLLETSYGSLEVWPVSMGNPHAVCLTPLPPPADWKDVGRQIEESSAFPRKTNVEFVSLPDADCLEVRVWERGSGATLACGTGAAASLAVTHKLGLTGPQARIFLPGGQLTGQVTPAGRIMLRGPVELSFRGWFTWPPDSETLIGGVDIG